MRAIQLAAISHRPFGEERHTLADGRICIRLRTAYGDFDAVTLYHACKYKPRAPWTRAEAVPMQRKWRDGVHDMWQAIYMPDDPRQIYWFGLKADGETLLHDVSGTRPMPEGMEGANGFHFAHAYPTPDKPAWARGTVGYQIFPDRFSRMDRFTAEELEPWGSRRVDNEYRFGGNLAGITDEIQYLREVGAQVVYLTPIFKSNTSHRYNTYDYEHVDPLLGTDTELRILADALHKYGMRLVIDGVFNHCGVEFEPFRDAMEKGRDSQYYDWFFFGEQYPCGYMTFSDNYAPMPKLNLRNPDCAAYFAYIGRKWIREAHVDGWRLDVSPEVYPDFWRQFRREIMAEKPDAIMIAECWDDSREWCNAGDMFDGTMNYTLSYPIWDFFAYRAISLKQFDEAINRVMMMYPQAVHNAMWTFLSSHDTMRMFTRCGNSSERMRAAAFFQMTCPGVPMVYYGDEIAMRGGDDPECRRSMEWQRVASSRMLPYYERLTYNRTHVLALREGEMTTYEVGEDGLYAYLRGEGRNAALCAINTTDEPMKRMLRLPDWWTGDKYVYNMMAEKRLPVKGGEVTLTLKPWSGAVIVRD